MKKLNIITLGCSKNTVDSEKLLAQFRAAGYNVVFDNYDKGSDIVIINTCGFINDAKEESIDTIIDFAEAKKRGEISELYVMGCLSQRYREELRSEIPEVDNYFGVNTPAEVLEGLKKKYQPSLENERILTGPDHYAYLKISEGCNRTCAFCAIPSIRGPYISVPEEVLVDEAKILADKGVKELILIAQDLSYYGLDLYGEQRLPQLVRKLAAIDDIKWIRLHYLYPANFPLEIIDLMITEPKLCRYIDLPVQHISDRVLSLMKRSHGGKDTRGLLKKIRDRLPDAAIRSTLITGHPGETEEDFMELLEFVREFRFDRLGVFTYSHEEGTYGGINYEDDIHDEVKQARQDKLMSLQQEISLERNLAMTGTTTEVIIDRTEGSMCIGRTRLDSPDVDQEISFPCPGASLKPGDFTKVKITSAGEYDLEGELV